MTDIKLTKAELVRLSQAVETDEGTGYIYAVAYAVESILAARLPTTTDAEARIAELEADVDWWRDKFNALFDEEHTRHRASPLASGEGNIRILQVRVTEKWFKIINRYRKSRNLSVSAAARELIEAGLAHKDGEDE